MFDVSPRSGVIPPRSEILITTYFHSHAMGCFSCDQYTFKTPGNSHTTLVLSGTSMPPVITMRKEVSTSKNGGEDAKTVATLSTLGGSSYNSGSPFNSLNFRDIEIGHLSTRLFYLRNTSARDTFFCIDGDEEGVFKMVPRQGT